MCKCVCVIYMHAYVHARAWVCVCRHWFNQQQYKLQTMLRTNNVHKKSIDKYLFKFTTDTPCLFLFFHVLAVVAFLLVAVGVASVPLSTPGSCSLQIKQNPIWNWMLAGIYVSVYVCVCMCMHACMHACVCACSYPYHLGKCLLIFVLFSKQTNKNSFDL